MTEKSLLTRCMYCNAIPGEHTPNCMYAKVQVESQTSAVALPAEISDMLAQRGARYGSFYGHSTISRNLKNTCKEAPSWNKMTAAQQEAIELICHKLARICNGDPNYDDSWRDIAGYAQLIVDILNGKKT